jgi:hypothetical protein
MSTALKWRYVTNPPGYRAPQWMRSAAIAADGTVFAPATVSGDSEQAAVLKAAWDGDVPLVIDDGHAYLPTWWLAKVDAIAAEICTSIETRMRADA